MKKALMYLFLFILSFNLIACTSSTEYGNCVGLPDIEEAKKQNPNIIYKISTKNVILGVIFVEMIIPPIIVVLDETYCPVGVKNKNIIDVNAYPQVQ